MGTGRGIADITPLTLLDFPNKVACIFWLRGCNLFCQYCYNVSLVRGTDSPAGDRTDYLDFLRDRVGFLDGVVLSGGECTLCPDLCRLSEWTAASLTPYPGRYVHLAITAMANQV